MKLFFNPPTFQGEPNKLRKTGIKKPLQKIGEVYLYRNFLLQRTNFNSQF